MQVKTDGLETFKKIMPGPIPNVNICFSITKENLAFSRCHIFDIQLVPMLDPDPPVCRVKWLPVSKYAFVRNLTEVFGFFIKVRDNSYFLLQGTVYVPLFGTNPFDDQGFLTTDLNFNSGAFYDRESLRAEMALAKLQNSKPPISPELFDVILQGRL